MDYKVVISQELSSAWDKRYIIVDENNKLLDDAQGYGYKTAQNAHKAWTYKNRDKSKDKQKQQLKKQIKQWLKENPNIQDTIETELFYALKDGEDIEFNVSFLKNVLQALKIECPFKHVDVLKILKS